MRAVIYTRQSLDKHGTGLAVVRQLAEGERLCKARGYEITARESDNDMSGFTGKHRPGYQRVIDMMRRGDVDVVVCYAVDRLTRRLADLATLIDLCEETGVTIATVAGEIDLSTSAGKLVARILGSVAQGESETKAARQQLANRQEAEAGRARKGMPRPFGWQADRITLDPEESAAIADGYRAVLAGGTLAGIMRDWDSRGVYPHQRPRNAPFGPVQFTGWTRTSVREILRNPRNAGIAVYKGTETGKGEWQAVVTEDVFRAAMDVLSDPARRLKVQGVRTLLGRIGLCACGNYLTGFRRETGRTGYRCNQESRNGRPGPHAYVDQESTDRAIGALVVGRLSMPDAVELVTVPAGVDVTALRDEAAAVRARLGRLGALFAVGTITEADMTGGRAAGEARLAQIEAELAEAGRESVLAPLVAARNVAEAWGRLGTDRRRAVVDALMTVTLQPPGRGVKRFDPDKVISVEWKHGS